MTDRLSIRFDSLFKLQQGKYLPPDAMVDEPSSESPYPVYGANGIIGYCDLPKYEEPRVLVSCRGANCGVVHLTEPHAWVSNNSIALEPLPEAPTDSSFVHALLRASSFLDVITGSAQPQITVSNLGRKEILVPLFETQKKIGDIERLLSGLIANNGRRIEILEETARLLYREWFVNFRYPGHEDVPLVDSELGLIPEGWEIRDLGDLCCEMRSGNTPRRSQDEYWDAHHVDWFTTGELQDNFLLGSAEGLSMDGQAQARTFEAGTILMAIYGSPTVGRLGVLTKQGSCNQAALAMNANLEICSQEFLYFKLMELRRFFNAIAQGAAQQNISKEKVHDSRISCPPIGICEAFGEIVKPIWQLTASLTRATSQLTEARDLLLPRLVSGDLDVSDLDLEMVG